LPLPATGLLPPDDDVYSRLRFTRPAGDGFNEVAEPLRA
jgi:hypothetical protein